MSRLRRAGACAAALMGVAGCAGTPPSTQLAPTTQAHAPAPVLDRLVILESEMDPARTESVYELIQRVRPEFFRPKQVEKFTHAIHEPPPAPVVMVNGARYGDLSDLRSVLASDISSVRFYPIEQAKVRFGMQYTGGVLEMLFLSFSTSPSSIP